MATFAEMSVALQVSRHRLETDLIKMRHLAERIGLSAGSVMIAAEGFERDVMMVDQAAAFLKVASRYEQEIMDLIKRKESNRSWFSGLASALSVI